MFGSLKELRSVHDARCQLLKDKVVSCFMAALYQGGVS
jgi:DnaJ-domain-containing protein 1